MSSQPPAEIRAGRQVSLPDALPPPFPTRPGSPIPIDPRPEGSLTAEDHVPLWTSEDLTDRRQVITVDTLPDEVLLAVFNSYLCEIKSIEGRTRAWQSLVHVCRRWRSIIFGSPRCLNLQLVCTGRTPTRDTLDVWPALPLVIWCNRTGSVDNIIAGLERKDRVCQITLFNLRSSDIFFAEMQQPFPGLTSLSLHSEDETVPVVPDSFLGGSARHLENLWLNGIPFPGLPRLLLSAIHLQTLYLKDIPHSGYISPDAMVTILSTLTSLSTFLLEFQSPRSRPDWASRRLPPLTPFVLSLLKRFTFKGVSEYLEELVACIDFPQLTFLGITFFKDIDIIFNTPQLTQFISRTPMSRALENAHITLRNRDANLCVSSQTSGDRKIKVKILCRGLDLQLSSLEQVCTSCFPSLSMLEDLYIYEDPYSLPDWKDIENGLWLGLLHPLTAVKNLYLSGKLAMCTGPALQELAEGRMTEVLPALRNIFLIGYISRRHIPEGIVKFVAARQVASRPIALSKWADPVRDKVYYL